MYKVGDVFTVTRHGTDHSTTESYTIHEILDHKIELRDSNGEYGWIEPDKLADRLRYSPDWTIKRKAEPLPEDLFTI